MKKAIYPGKKERRGSGFMVCLVCTNKPNLATKLVALYFADFGHQNEVRWPKK